MLIYHIKELYSIEYYLYYDTILSHLCDDNVLCYLYFLSCYNL